MTLKLCTVRDTFFSRVLKSDLRVMTGYSSHDNNRGARTPRLSSSVNRFQCVEIADSVLRLKDYWSPLAARGSHVEVTGLDSTPNRHTCRATLS